MNVALVLFYTGLSVFATINMANQAKLHVFCPWEVDKFEKTGDISVVSQECRIWFNTEKFCRSSGRFKQPLGGGYINCEAIWNAWRESAALGEELGYGYQD